MTHPTGGNAVDRRMALAREWEDLVAQVRDLDGFEDFLGSPTLKKLLPAAERGPIVIVNVSRWRCDALIVRPDGVAACELPDLTLGEANARAEDYLAVLSTAELADVALAGAQQPFPGETRRSRVRRGLQASRAQDAAHQRADEMLVNLQAWMWDVIAEPVLNELRCTSTPAGDPSTWPRVWWCPTGPLTLLPLHAAGRHADLDDRTVLDRVVSSYTPTLRALLETRCPDEKLDNAGSDLDRLLLVDVPDLPNLMPIDNAAERDVLLAAFSEDRRTVLDTAQATPDAVRAALPHHRWVHFSCHGDQDLKDPSRGGLQLRGGALTVADITASRFRGDFAGLSACKTAVGGVDLLDEVITLAAALHYTGYRHVIAALWSVDNKASAEVFSSLPEMIVFKRGEPARVVEDGHEFTPAASFTAGTDPCVTWAKVLLNVAQLLVEALLGADEVRGLAAQQLARDRAALGPGMRGARAGIAEIERHDVQRGYLIRVRTREHRGASPVAAVCAGLEVNVRCPCAD